MVLAYLIFFKRLVSFVLNGQCLLQVVILDFARCEKDFSDTALVSSSLSIKSLKKVLLCAKAFAYQDLSE